MQDRMQLAQIVFIATIMVASTASGQEVMQFIRGPAVPQVLREVALPDGQTRLAYLLERDLNACAEYQYSTQSTHAQVAQRGYRVVREERFLSPDKRADYVFWTMAPDGRHTVYRASYSVRSCLLFEQRTELAVFRGDRALSQAQDRYRELAGAAPSEP